MKDTNMIVTRNKHVRGETDSQSIMFSASNQCQSCHGLFLKLHVGRLVWYGREFLVSKSTRFKENTYLRYIAGFWNCIDVTDYRICTVIASCFWYNSLLRIERRVIWFQQESFCIAQWRWKRLRIRVRGCCMNNGLHLALKYARIFMRGHYNYLLRALKNR